MTNEDKRELRQLCREGDTFEEIRSVVSCADSTIKSYIKLFSTTDLTNTKDRSE